MDLGLQLRQLRLQKGLSLAQLSGQLNGLLSPQTLSLYELDKQMCPLPNLQLILGVLDAEATITNEKIMLQINPQRNPSFKKECQLKTVDIAKIQALHHYITRKYPCIEELDVSLEKLNKTKLKPYSILPKLWCYELPNKERIATYFVETNKGYVIHIATNTFESFLHPNHAYAPLVTPIWGIVGQTSSTHDILEHITYQDMRAYLEPYSMLTPQSIESHYNLDYNVRTRKRYMTQLAKDMAYMHRLENSTLDLAIYCEKYLRCKRIGITHNQTYAELVTDLTQMAYQYSIGNNATISRYINRDNSITIDNTLYAINEDTLYYEFLRYVYAFI